MHPQNSLPVFAPLRAVRRTIGRSHRGQFGTDAGSCAETPLMVLFRPIRMSISVILYHPSLDDVIGDQTVPG